MRAFVDKMHQRGQQWMPLVNAGVAAAKGFRAYDEGSKDGIWIKDNEGADYHGQVRGVQCCLAQTPPADTNINSHVASDVMLTYQLFSGAKLDVWQQQLSACML